jgi:hypothetical protein
MVIYMASSIMFCSSWEKRSFKSCLNTTDLGSSLTQRVKPISVESDDQVSVDAIYPHGDMDCLKKLHFLDGCFSLTAKGSLF